MRDDRDGVNCMEYIHRPELDPACFYRLLLLRDCLECDDLLPKTNPRRRRKKGRNKWKEAVAVASEEERRSCLR